MQGRRCGLGGAGNRREVEEVENIDDALRKFEVRWLGC